MRLIFSDKGWGDYLYWQKNDKQILKKINQLIKDIKREPLDAIKRSDISSSSSATMEKFEGVKNNVCFEYLTKSTK